MNTFCLHVKEPFGLNDLKALVHHSGRIDSNLSTHIPVGMLEGLGLGSFGYLILLPGAERAAGSCQVNLFHRIAMGAQQALEDGRMFRIYRIDGSIAAGGLPHHQRTGSHQGFLVGQGDGFAGTDGSQRGFEPAETYHSSYHHLHLGSLDQLTGGINAQTDIYAREGLLHLLELVRIADYHMWYVEGASLLNQKISAAVGRNHKHAEAVRVLSHHVQRLRANGTGRT